MIAEQHHGIKMKKWLFILLLIPLFAHSQQISGLNRFVVGGLSSGGGGGGGGTGVAIDTSYEVLTFASIMNVSYNPLRPNKQVTSTTDFSFFMNYVPDGFGGNVRFIITSGVPHVNGTLATAFPTAPATVVKTYNKTTGNPLMWN